VSLTGFSTDPPSMLHASPRPFDQRALVENAAAFGITQAAIAEQLKIDEKTLRTSRSASLC
jgi:DNA-binding NarL/FixJ family response regulator